MHSAHWGRHSHTLETLRGDEPRENEVGTTHSVRLLRLRMAAAEGGEALGMHAVHGIGKEPHMGDLLFFERGQLQVLQRPLQLCGVYLRQLHVAKRARR